MDDSRLPPKVVRKALLDRCRETEILPATPGGRLSGGAPLPSRWDPATLARHAGSLPVLAAFQEFLEMERERTRKRFLAVTVLSALALLLVIGVGGAAAMFFYSRTKHDVRNLRSDVVALRAEASNSVATARQALAAFEQQTRRLGEDLLNGQAALGAVRQKVDAEKTARTADLDQMKRSMEGLARENASLKRGLEEMLATWPAVSNAIEVALLRIATPPPREDRVPQPPRAVVQRPAAQDSFVMSIVPRNGGAAVDWRFPIPE